MIPHTVAVSWAEGEGEGEGGLTFSSGRKGGD